jgi:hypothetical protein
MNDPIRLSADGSAFAKHLLAAGRRERPRDEERKKAAALAAALLVAGSRWRLVFSLRGWRSWLLALGAAGMLAGLVSSVWSTPARLAEDDVLLDRASAIMEPLPLVPRTFEPSEQKANPPAVDRRAVAAPLAAEPIVALPTELELLRRARIANAAGDPAAGLALLDEHARLYPSGALVEEAAALRIEALVRSHDERTARAEALRFEKRFPQSAYLERIRALTRAD